MTPSLIGVPTEKMLTADPDLATTLPCAPPNQHPRPQPPLTVERLRIAESWAMDISRTLTTVGSTGTATRAWGNT